LRSSRRDREREARRETILDAAEKLVFENGFDGWTMEDVAAASELSKGALYLYFENKDALCAAIALRSIERHYPTIEEDAARLPRGLDRVRFLLENHGRHFTTSPHLLRFAIGWFLKPQPVDDSTDDFRAYRDRVGRGMLFARDAIELGRSDGSIRADVDPLALALQLWSGLLGVLLLGAARDGFQRRIPLPLDLDAALPLYIDNMLRAIEGPRASENE
jgi:AcrR family transcriptional regulator